MSSLVPGPFPSARAALRWYWGMFESRCSPKALDPGRQNISGSSDGLAKVCGQYVDIEGTYALVALCLRQFTQREIAILKLGYFASAAHVELSGYDARTIRSLHSPLARRATAWLRAREMLREE